MNRIFAVCIAGQDCAIILPAMTRITTCPPDSARCLSRQAAPSVSSQGGLLYSIAVGKREYVGMTIRPLSRRLTLHKTSARYEGRDWPLHRALRKHNFAASIRPICAAPRPALPVLEKTAIDWLAPSLNATKGGEGVPLSPKQEKRRREALNASMRTTAYRQKMSRLMTGRVFTKKHRLALSRAARNRKCAA